MPEVNENDVKQLLSIKYPKRSFGSLFFSGVNSFFHLSSSKRRLKRRWIFQKKKWRSFFVKKQFELKKFRFKKKYNIKRKVSSFSVKDVGHLAKKIQKVNEFDFKYQLSNEIKYKKGSFVSLLEKNSSVYSDKSKLGNQLSLNSKENSKLVSPSDHDFKVKKPQIFLTPLSSVLKTYDYFNIKNEKSSLKFFGGNNVSFMVKSIVFYKKILHFFHIGFDQKKKVNSSLLKKKIQFKLNYYKRLISFYLLSSLDISFFNGFFFKINKSNSRSFFSKYTSFQIVKLYFQFLIPSILKQQISVDSFKKNLKRKPQSKLKIQKASNIRIYRKKYNLDTNLVSKKKISFKEKKGHSFKRTKQK